MVLPALGDAMRCDRGRGGGLVAGGGQAECHREYGTCTNTSVYSTLRGRTGRLSNDTDVDATRDRHRTKRADRFRSAACSGIGAAALFHLSARSAKTAW